MPPAYQGVSVQNLSWGMWIVRTAIAWIGGAAIAWGVSFWVADYVVKAHTTGTGNTMDTINATLARMDGTLNRVEDALAAHTADLATIKTAVSLEARQPLALPEWLNPEAFAQIALDAGRARAIAEEVSFKVDDLTSRVTVIEARVTDIVSSFRN